MTTVTVNGNSYSDDGSVPAHDMQNGGHRTQFLPMISDAMIDTAAKVSAAQAARDAAIAAQSAAAASAASAVSSPGTNATSTTSLTIATGAQSLTIQTGKAIVVGMQVIIANTASPANWMFGTVTSYVTGTGVLGVTVSNIAGSGVAVTTWTISLSGVAGVTGVVNKSKGANIASAATVNLDAATGNLIHITGTTGITAFTLAAGSDRTLIFDGILTITNSANVICPGGVNITTAVGDECNIVGDSAGVVNLLDYVRKSGQSNLVPAVVPVGALIAFDSEIQSNTYVDPLGFSYLKTGVIADSSTYPLAASSPWVSAVTKTPQTSTLPTGQSSAVAYGNGVWVAVKNGQCSTSPDGYVWSAIAPLTGMTNSGGAGGHQIVFNGTYFLVTDYNSAVSAKSTDGVTWSYGVLPSSGNWLALAYGAGVWVAAKSGTTNVATSSDGVNWTLRTNSRTVTVLGYASGGNAMSFGNGVFVLIDTGTATSQLSTSPDGITWTNRTITAPVNYFINIVFGAGLHVIFSFEGVAAAAARTSPDGITWTSRSVGSSYPASGSAMGWFVLGQFCVPSNTTNRWCTSSDGITWTDNATVASGNNSMSHSGIVSVASNGTYALTFGASANIGRSTDGVYWGGVNGGAFSGTYQTLSYGGGKYFSAASGNMPCQASTDGVNWWQIVPSYTSTSGSLTGSAYFNSMYVTGNASFYFTSPDLITWTSRTIPTSNTNGFHVAGNKLFSLANTAAYSYSTDGITFTNSAIFTTAAVWVGVTYGGTTYLAFDGTSIVNTSIDGISWTLRTIAGLSGNILKIVYASGYFVCVSTTGFWYKSSDGITWSAISFYYGYSSAVPTSVCTDGVSVWAFTAASSIGYVLTSTGVLSRRVLQNSVSGANRNMTIMTSATNIIAVASSISISVGTVPAINKILNDTNQKTYNVTTAEQVNFYKRVA